MGPHCLPPHFASTLALVNVRKYVAASDISRQLSGGYFAGALTLSNNMQKHVVIFYICFQDESSGVESEVCCCKGDNCFLPDWFDIKHHQEGQSGKAQQRQDNSGWQRTLLICIGVALAFLAVCKYFQAWKQESISPNHFPTKTYGQAHLIMLLVVSL